MRKGVVYCKNRRAGILTEAENGYTFTYDVDYMSDPTTSHVSLSLPKSQREYHSKVLFPFFFGLLTEGDNARMQCRVLHLDLKDYMGRLLTCAGEDTIGAVTVKPEEV